MNTAERAALGMGKGAKAAVMAAFLDAPADTRFTTRELAAGMTYTESTVRRAATDMALAGFVKSDKHHGARRYWIEPSKIAEWRRLLGDKETGQ